MTVTGSASAEVLIPGNPSAIQTAHDTAAAGIEPAKHISTAWGSMRLPGWKGQAGTAWQAFTPREAMYTSKAPSAMRTVASALADYQAAFTLARAEAAAAILDAQAAERLTNNALTEHQTATRKAQTAKPGTPEAKVSPYRDPGAIPLANAQTRLDNARTALNNAGNAAAARINTASLQTSNVSPTIVGAGHVRPTVKSPPIGDPVGEFVKGFVTEGWETILGLNELIEATSPSQRMIRDLRNLITGGPDGVFKQYQKDFESFIAAVSDPAGTMREIWRQLSAEDYWKEHPAEAAGRVTFNVASLIFPFTKLGKFGRLGKAGEAAAAAEKVSKLKLRTLLPGEKLRLGEMSRGMSDGGPGLWEKSPKRSKGQEYQEFITKMERGTEYKVNGINFDGYDKARDVLIDAKDWKKWPPAGQTFWQKKTFEEIERQVRAANGKKVEWHFSSQAAKDAVDQMLQNQKVRISADEFETVYTPVIK